MYKINYALKTIKGRRATNQDYCIAEQIQKGVYFFSVADGMGGTAGGQIASRLVIENAVKILNEELQYKIENGELKFILERVFLSSQQIIAKKVKENPTLAGMGTTLTCLLIKDNKYVWGNIGDSRIYLLRNNNINQITTDHSFIEELKNSHNLISHNILKKYGNFLQRALDGGKDEADIFPKNSNYEVLRDDDIFLLCSDGLIVDKTIDESNLLKEQILHSRSLNKACNVLIKNALERGSQDNISVVLIGIGNYEKVLLKRRGRISLFSGLAPIKKKYKKRKYSSSTFIGFIIIFLSLVIALLLISEKKTYQSKEIINLSSQIKENLKAKHSKKIVSNNLQNKKSDIPVIEFTPEKNDKNKKASIVNKRTTRSKKSRHSGNQTKTLSLNEIDPMPAEKLNNPVTVNENSRISKYIIDSNAIIKEKLLVKESELYMDSEFKQIINKFNESISNGNKNEATKILIKAIDKYSRTLNYSNNKAIVEMKIKVLQEKIREIRNMK